MVILPLLIMVVVYVVQSYFDPASAEELASSTINAMAEYIGEKLPYVILADFAGAIIGVIFGASMRK
ncbi:MAG: hypothetical protein PVJ08_00760 [Dehalococcoidia bacterium]|jgi:hypothetical protein